MNEIMQIDEGHHVMLSILESRKIKLDAALTFWRKEDITQLVSYLLKTDDDSLFADVLPCLAHCIREENTIGKKVTLGICTELLPVLQRLLKSKYEDYVVKSLDFMRIMSQNWFMELRDMKENGDHQKNQSLALQQFREANETLLDQRTTMLHMGTRRQKMNTSPCSEDESKQLQTLYIASSSATTALLPPFLVCF